MKFYHYAWSVLLCLCLALFISCGMEAEKNDVALTDSTHENQEVVEDQNKLHESQQETEPDAAQTETNNTPKIELNPCIDNSMEFDSLQEMEEQIGAIQRLTLDNPEYITYSSLNLSDVSYYYLPAHLNGDLFLEYTGYSLVNIRILPYMFTFTYQQDSTGAHIQYDIIRKYNDDDPLAEIEKRYDLRRNDVGHVYVPQYNRTEMYYMKDDNYMICLTIYKEWFEKNNITTNYFMYFPILSDVRRQNINTKPTHVTE